MKRVLVTGARGLLGQAVLPALERRGFEIHGVGRQPSPPNLSGTWHSCDLLAEGTAQRLLREVRPTHVLHLAWETGHGAFWTSPANAYWVDATTRLARAFAEERGERFVGVGSCAEYEWNETPCDERRTALQPATPYGRAKLQAQQTVADIAEANGLSWSWPRLFHLFGPREPRARLVPSIVRACLNNYAPSISDPDKVRDFLYVEDAADALAALVASDVKGPVNIGSGTPLAVGAFASFICERAAPGLTARTDRSLRRKDDPRLLVPLTRLLNERVGWNPPTPLPVAIDHTIAWWKEHQWK